MRRTWHPNTERNASRSRVCLECSVPCYARSLAHLPLQSLTLALTITYHDSSFQVHELAAKGKGRNWLGFGGGGGGGGGDSDAVGNDDAARWQHAAQVYATKLAEAEANIKNLQVRR